MRSLFSLSILPFAAMGQSPLPFTEILGRPTDRSVALSVLFDQPVEIYVRYGTASGVYTERTATHSAVAGTPLVKVLEGLQPNTRYFYRTSVRTAGDTSFVPGAEHTFHTQRSPGSTFTFTVESDAHPYDKKGSHRLLDTALANQLADSPDFLLDLGDTFGDDHAPFTITSEEVRQLHLDWRSYFGTVCHSSPLFLSPGNHEGESGYYLLQTPPNNLAVYETIWRTFYFPNPVPDGFYSGNTEVEGFGIGAPQNYYAWEWGDALFIVLDAYRYCTANAKPRGWDWTIGKAQYDWFRGTLERSRAKYKFVFAHHTLGETRGGVTTAPLYEWGGHEADKSTWGFDANRPGWGKPIHQVMATNGVGIYFQGHDHLFATEEIDGMVYQEVPMPSDSTYIIGLRDNGSAYTGIILDGAGHLRVTVAPESVTVAYVESRLPADEDSLHWNRRVVYSYSVRPGTTAAPAEPSLPAQIVLDQNFPNPFNPTTVIGYALPSRGYVTIRVFDLLGKEVAVLVSGEREAGTHSVQWSATGIPTGVYFYQLRANGRTDTRKAVLLR